MFLHLSVCGHSKLRTYFNEIFSSYSFILFQFLKLLLFTWWQHRNENHLSSWLNLPLLFHSVRQTYQLWLVLFIWF